MQCTYTAAAAAAAVDCFLGISVDLFREIAFEREYGDRVAEAEVVEKRLLLAFWERAALKETRTAVVRSMAGRRSSHLEEMCVVGEWSE